MSDAAIPSATPRPPIIGSLAAGSASIMRFPEIMLMTRLRIVRFS